MNFPRSTEPRPLFKHVVIGSCRTYDFKFKQQPQAAITYNGSGIGDVALSRSSIKFLMFKI